MSPAVLARSLASAQPRLPLPQALVTRLRRRNAVLQSDEPDVFPADEVSRVWRVRLETSQAKGTPLRGAGELLTHLRELPPSNPVLQFAYMGDQIAAVIFFDQATEAFLGYALMDKDEALAA